MNNIYKVIWSKAKNCYVVASEIARSHTKSASGSEKIGGIARHALLALGAACAIACGGFVNVGAAESVDVPTIGGSQAKVYTKDGTESYVHDKVEAELRSELNYYYKKSDVDARLEALTTTGDVATNKNNINDLKIKAESTGATLTDLSGRMAVAESDIDGLQAGMSTAQSNINDLKIKAESTGATLIDLSGRMAAAESDIDGLQAGMSTAQSDISTLKGDMLTAKGDIGTLKTKDTELDQKIDKEIQDRENAIKDTNDRTGGIARNAEKTQTTIEGIVKVDNQGNVKDVKDLSAETITTKGDAVIGGDLKVTGETTLNDKLTAKGEATFEKNVIAEKDLTVNGKLNVGEIYLENNKLEAATGKKHDSATAITADGISNLAKVTEHGNTTESQFTHNEKGTINYAKVENSTGDWKGSTSKVTADGVSNKMTDSDGNTHTYSQTAAETKEQLVNGDKSNFEKKTAEGNTISIKDKDAAGNPKSLTNKQTVDGEKTSVTNNESSSTINQGADQIRHNVTSADGKKSSIEVKADGITNTSKDGTITNDAKDIVNNATGNMTNTVGGDLTTTVGGNEPHEVTGTKTENVTGKVTENYGNGQETNVTGDQYLHVTGKQTNKIDGDQENIIGGNQTTTVTGDISNKAENITNEANTKLTDKVGDNTRVLDSEGITDTVPGAGGKGSTFRQRIDAIMGNVKTDAGESEMTQTGDEITSVVAKGEATISRVTQKKGSIEAVVTDGTSFNHSRDIANASAKTLTGYGKMNQLLDDLNSSTKTITDGTHKTSKVQTALDITNTAADGTITNDAKNIVNNASGDMTNTVGGKLTTTVTGATEENYNGGLTTNVTGEENHTVTGKQNNKVTGKQTNTVEGGQENIISGGQTNTITGGQINNITGDQTTTITGNKTETVTENVTEDYKKNLTTTVGGNEIHEVKGTKTETVEGKVIENFKGGQETNVTGNQDIHVTGKQTNKIDGNQENTIGGDQTTNVTGDILNTAKNITNAATETLTDKVGTNTRVINSRSITDTVGAANRMIEDGKITDNAGDFTVTTDKENGTTFTNAGSTASSFTTVNGTNTGSAQGWTNVKGNEISTGKVEANYVKMDYADVMHDLGVHGSATVDNDLTVKGITTTKTLKVTENATVGGTLDVTKKATFHDDVDIAKNLSVGGNATITGDVTARSYKVDGKTYIDANGINANDQKITNVADGSISEGSKDAVNGGQLYGVKRDLEHQVDKVGANAAAMANLRPMEFDPSSKWNIAAAIGNYGSETAAAIGAFYRPNDNVMVNLSTAFGTGENMVGGGVSVRLGKGGNKLSREETNALKAQVADLTARMDALLSVLNPNMSKDFPDVPENHWAYEAVSRLAGNDIVQGYPDGEFHGERTMTRYEMAEIIYNALSRGAEAERKLVEEFKPELQAMAASEKATAEKAEG